MNLLEEIYADTLDTATRIASERKCFYSVKQIDVLFSITETTLSLHYKVQIWGNLR